MATPDLSDPSWTQDHFVHWLDKSKDVLDGVLDDEATKELVREAIGYYNNHNGRVLKESIELPSGQDNAVTTPQYMGTVVDVEPNKLRIDNPDIKTEFDLSHVRIFDDFWLARTQSAVTEWSAIRRVHQHHFDQFYGNEFKWDFEMGKIIYQNLPKGDGQKPNRLLVRYYPNYKTYGATDDDPTSIADSYAKRWLKRYMSALAKLEEGNLTSKATAVGVDVGGQNVRSQAEQEKEKLEEKLHEESTYYPIRS